MTALELPASALCTTPNAQAPPPRLGIKRDSITVQGYQNYTLGSHEPVPAADDAKLQRKRALLENIFTPSVMRNRTLLDLGANAGFFSFWALRAGARAVRAVDIDEEYLDLLTRAGDAMEARALHIVRGNVADEHEPADIVTAFALVHWLYSCSSAFGSLEKVVSFLAGLTKNLLLIEWIAPEDPAIQTFGHTAYNADCIIAPYSFEEFSAALAEHFEVVETLGYVEPTRKLFAAWKSRRASQLDMSCPLQEIFPAAQLLTSRRLAPSAEGIHYWSRVYDLGDRIAKQASADLAAREAEFLAELGGPYFPRLIGVRREQGFSVLIEEKIEGTPLNEALHHLRKDRQAMRLFIAGCLEILQRLRELGIIHRDILPSNLLVRDGAPVLLDFGWAQRADRPFVIPHDLGRGLRPPDGSFCDLFSMGKVFSHVIAESDGMEGLEKIISLMINPDPTLRMMDLVLLEDLFSTLIPEQP